MKPQIIIDTSVLVAALRSRNGAAYAVLKNIGRDRFDIHLSPKLVTEYRAVLSRFANEPWFVPGDVEAVIDDFCRLGYLHDIFYLWRPALADAGDEHILELAVAARAAFIVTHNVRHFSELGQFGVEAITPLQLLRMIGATNDAG